MVVNLKSRQKSLPDSVSGKLYSFKLYEFKLNLNNLSVGKELQATAQILLSFGLIKVFLNQTDYHKDMLTV